MEVSAVLNTWNPKVEFYGTIASFSFSINVLISLIQGAVNKFPDW
jgi:hypothetical protein